MLISKFHIPFFGTADFSMILQHNIILKYFYGFFLLFPPKYKSEQQYLSNKFVTETCEKCVYKILIKVFVNIQK